jgi:multidrug transporter EmrE-like cation transporter
MLTFEKLLSLNYIYWLLISIVFYAIGEYLSKKFALNPSILAAVCVLFVYSLGALAWLPAILQKNILLVAGTVWALMGFITTVLVGMFFGEQLNTLRIVGISLGLISILLLTKS